jgi:hypothetical protein
MLRAAITPRQHAWHSDETISRFRVLGAVGYSASADALTAIRRDGCWCFDLLFFYIFVI